MAMTIVEATRTVVGGIDMHSRIHVAAALDGIGGLLGDPSPSGRTRPDNHQLDADHSR